VSLSRGLANSRDGLCDFGRRRSSPLRPGAQVSPRDEGGNTQLLREVEHENSDSANSLLPVLRPKQAFNHMPGRISSTPGGPSSSARFVREEE